MRRKMFVSLAVTAIMIFTGVYSSALAKDTRLSIGTAGTTGVFYAYGGALASVVSKKVENLNVTAEATGGSVENLRLLMNGEIDIATTGADSVYKGFYEYKKSKYFKEKTDVRALFNMYTQPHHIVARKDGRVSKVQEIRGKRVSVGSPGSGTEIKTRLILKALGIEYSDFDPQYLTFSESAEALQDGNIDAAFMGVAYPAPAITSLALTVPVKLIPLADDEADEILAALPFLTRAKIPGGLYKGVDSDVPTIAVQTVVICRKDLSEDVVYDFVKAVFENKEELNLIHRSFKETTLENATPTIVPLHPGAEKFYSELEKLKEK